MLLQTLYDILARMLALKIIQSEREFCLDWLGMSATYLNDYRSKGRILADVSARTTSTLRYRLVGVADFLADPMKSEIGDLIELIDQSILAAKALRR